MVNNPQTDIVVIEWKAMKKGDSLQGFITLTLPSGMVLHECTLHERPNGARWIGMPARSYTAKDGSTSWVRVVDFSTKDAYERFQRQALAAVDDFFAQQPQPERRSS